MVYWAESTERRGSFAVLPIGFYVSSLWTRNVPRVHSVCVCTPLEFCLQFLQVIAPILGVEWLNDLLCCQDAQNVQTLSCVTFATI